MTFSKKAPPAVLGFVVLTFVVLTFILVLVSAKARVHTSPAAMPRRAVGVNPLLQEVQWGTSNLYVAPEGNDANPGSGQAPFGTIQHAANFALPGTTIHVAPGIYMEAVNVTVSGAPGAPIRFVSDYKWQAVVVGDGSVNDAFMLRGNYLDIVNFQVTNGSGYQGIELYGSYDRAIGNHVRNVWAAGCVDSRGGAGINSSNPTGHDNQIAGNLVHDIGDYAHGCAAVHGIYIANPGNMVQNNVAFRNQGWGITSWHNSSRNVISNNTVFNNDVGGINTGGTDGTVDDNTLVANNIVVLNGVNTGNLRFGIGQEGSNGPNCAYINNLVFGNQPADFSVSTGMVTGTIIANPAAVFVNYTGDGFGDYRLRAGSPAVGKGTPQGAPAVDFNGSPRSAPPDIGAYQSTP